MKKLFIIGIAALLLVAFTVPAMAKVKIGGIIFTDFYYLDRDRENSQAWGTGNDPYQVTTIQVPNITRLNARWTNEDNVGMFIELGIGQSSGAVDLNTSNGVSLRHAYGWWDVNPNFQIMAGKSTTPFSPLNPSQMIGTRSGSVNIIGVGYGNLYAGRFAQVRGTFKFGKMGRVALALVDPNGTIRIAPTGFLNFYPGDQWGAVLGTDYQNNSKIPRFDLGVPLYFGPVSIYPSFMYQYRSVDVINPALSRYDNSMHVYAGSLGVKAGFGPFAITAEGQWGKNWGNTRTLIGTSAPALIAAAQLNPVSGVINDATSYGYWIDASYKIGPVTPHVMFGQMNSSVDAYNALQARQAELDGTSTFWGFSVPIDLAKGFRIRPELMW
jgi:porin-like protein